MNHSAKIVSAIFYEHALVAILAVSVIHAMKREQSPVAITHFGSQRHFGSKCRTRHLLFSSNTPTRGDYLGYKSIKIESILSIKIDKYR
jgi:hypothetical protein